MSFFEPAPEPPTKLGRYRLLSPLAGVHVSPLVLGAMSIGDRWSKFGMGSMTKEDSFKLLDAYYDKGGNFIDTANNYQDETSERFIGEWAEERGIRDQLFIATKYTMGYKRATPLAQKVMYTGNNAKSLRISVEESLQKLRTSYIDLLYVHWWDWDTSIEEVMRSLHALVLSGKVLYLGVSDTPAWVVSKANLHAREYALSPFVIYQGMWNVMDRSFERDIIPMARYEGLALAPWNVVGGGKFRTDEEEERRRTTGERGRTIIDQNWERNEREKIISRALEKVAAEVGAKHITSGMSFRDAFVIILTKSVAMAIAYVMQKTTYVFPIIGGRKVEHLEANIEALSIALSEGQIEFLESVVDFDIGPRPMLISGAHLEPKPRAQPIRPISD
ncbi:NADP-dependent oxidoreductase domain-containing protein [Crepidotus variabilis]|uniref:NADP-dependent oxidoreductase domain-containing protein n=1 Tax=Crepidotus variabilis TaxID=179855 RepID=A0A9P6E3V1_9AGAR|nr:NADP-dependent oxidoreductase domain-containing protein [Crepidotus variabilis]